MTELFNNIRSLYHFKVPCEELKKYVEFFSESCFELTNQTTNGQPFSIKMFKSWTPTFWINLGPSYKLVLDGNVHHIRANNAILVTRAATAERVNQASDHLFTVKFHPGALNHLIAIDQTKLYSKVIALNELIPLSLVEKLKSAEDFGQR